MIGVPAWMGALIIVLIFFGIPYSISIWVVGIWAERWSMWAQVALGLAVFGVIFVAWNKFLSWLERMERRKTDKK